MGFKTKPGALTFTLHFFQNITRWNGQRCMHSEGAYNREKGIPRINKCLIQDNVIGRGDIRAQVLCAEW